MNRSNRTDTLFARTRSAIDEIAREVTEIANDTHSMMERNESDRLKAFSADNEQRLNELRAISKYVDDLLTTGMEARLAQANADAEQRQRQLNELAAHVRQLAEDAQGYIDQCAKSREEMARREGKNRRDAVETLAKDTHDMLSSYGWTH